MREMHDTPHMVTLKAHACMPCMLRFLHPVPGNQLRGILPYSCDQIVLMLDLGSDCPEGMNQARCSTICASVEVTATVAAEGDCSSVAVGKMF